MKTYGLCARCKIGQIFMSRNLCYDCYKYIMNYYSDALLFLCDWDRFPWENRQ